MVIDSDIINQLLLLLRPYLQNESERRAYLIRALGINTPVLNRLEMHTSVNTFIPNMVKELIEFGKIPSSGKLAICGLLEVIREDVGEDKQLRIDELIEEVQTQRECLPIPKLPQQLFEFLLKIDFKEQVILVHDALRQHRTVAFLVHGEPYYGHELLVTRLCRMTSKSGNASPIILDVSNKSANYCAKILWRQIGRSFRLPADAQPEEIIDRICNRWQTQDVVLIFNKVNLMLPEVLCALLQDLWEPLVERGKLKPPTQETDLVMFLVDNKGSVCQSEVMLAKQLNEPDYPRIPLQLPSLSSFKSDILKDFFIDIITSKDLDVPASLTYQGLLEKFNQGIPEDVYEEICSHFRLSWEGDLAKQCII